MRALTREPRAYVLQSEWVRLHEASTIKPTIFHVRPLTGADNFRWSQIEAIEVAEARGLTVEQRAQRALEIDTDVIASAIARIENWEPGGDGDDPIELTDRSEIRKAIDGLGVTDRNELARAVRHEAALDMGEPSRLRSLPMFSSGGEQNRPASESTAVSDAPAMETTAIVSA